MRKHIHLRVQPVLCVHGRFYRRKSNGKTAGFSRSYRASLDKISSVKFEVPDIDTQNAFMDKVTKLEAAIKACQSKLKSFAGMKEAALKKYL